MNKIIVAGNGTDVGKTIASAVLTTKLQADYWKPVQCGFPGACDSSVIGQLVDSRQHRIHPSSYFLKAFLSPHHAARLENIEIDTSKIIPPSTDRMLVIESVGGIMASLTTTTLTIDLFEQWEAQWVLVCKHYLGSINHTLLTIEALKRRGIKLLGLIFNGEPNPDSEAVIIANSRLPVIGRLLPEPILDINIIQRYATQWHIPS
jgi:dethiobiotin synthetase